MEQDVGIRQARCDMLAVAAGVLGTMAKWRFEDVAHSEVQLIAWTQSRGLLAGARKRIAALAQPPFGANPDIVSAVEDERSWVLQVIDDALAGGYAANGEDPLASAQESVCRRLTPLLLGL